MGKAIAELHERLEHGELIVVAGAGVAAAASAGADVAAWPGLLRAGIDHCREFGQPLLEGRTADLCEGLIDRGDVDLLLAVASVIESRLNAPISQEWRRWLRESIGSLQVINSELVDAIHDLDVPIVTTNYDSLLSWRRAAAPLPAITWRRPDKWIDVLNRQTEAVLHLHGWWDDPSSVILGIKSYEKVLGDRAAQEIPRALGRFNTLLFIGFGSGLKDPNLGPLLAWLSERDAPNHRHYVLLPKRHVADFPQSASVYPVEYGPNHEFLPKFLRALKESPGGGRLRGPGRDIVAVVRDLDTFSESDAVQVPRMVVIPRGSYLMGASPDTEEPDPRELPRHPVRIGYGFAVSINPVTFAEWDEFERQTGRLTRPRDLGWGRGSRPVIHVSWNDVQSYLEWINNLGSVEGTYRLLSEAEWEYVARAGATTRFWWGNGIDVDNANYDAAGLGKTSEVGSYPANGFGVYDTCGNVWEWVQDTFQDNYIDAPTDGSPWVVDANAQKRVIRGGCWYYDERYLECSARLGIDADVRFNSIGFRIGRTVRQPLSGGSRYGLLSVSSGLAATRDPGGAVHQQRWRGDLTQVWRVIETEDALMLSHDDDHVLGVADPRDRNLSKIIVEPLRGDAFQQWRAHPEGDGYVFENCGSRKVLDAEGISSEEGSPLIQFSRHGNSNQRWWIRPVAD